MAQANVNKPIILLFDEPLSNLDGKLRAYENRDEEDSTDFQYYKRLSHSCQAVAITVSDRIVGITY